MKSFESSKTERFGLKKMRYLLLYYLFIFCKKLKKVRNSCIKKNINNIMAGTEELKKYTKSMKILYEMNNTTTPTLVIVHNNQPSSSLHYKYYEPQQLLNHPP